MTDAALNHDVVELLNGWTIRHSIRTYRMSPGMIRTDEQWHVGRFIPGGAFLSMSGFHSLPDARRYAASIGAGTGITRVQAVRLNAWIPGSKYVTDQRVNPKL